MPVVRNILHIQGGASQAAALLDFIADRRYGRGSIDLNRITPMPPWVYRQPTNMELLRKYGEENCSRGWCLKHWGVDQNVLHPEQSVRQYDGGPAIRFDTMDGDVRELIRKLSLVFKELYLDYLWASEDVGSLVGAAQYRDGEPLIEFIPTPGSRAAIEKALDILGGKASDYGLVYNPAAGNYEYRGRGGNGMKQNENMTTLPLEMRVNRLDTQGGSCLAHLSMTLGECFAVRGIRLMEGKNGPFLSFPSYKAKDGYQDICFPLNGELRRQMTEAAVDAYHQALEQHQTRQEEPEPGPEMAM